MRHDAWIGDSVLGLFARLYILRTGGEMDGEKYERMTSNQFLSAFGEPTAIEAELGRVFANEGLDAAFAWVEEKLLPRFEREEANRRRHG